MTPVEFEPRTLSLRDRRTVTLRPIDARDQAELLQTFFRMTPDARHMRFMANVQVPDVALLKSVLASFPGSGFGIAATVPAADGYDIVGAASFMEEGGGNCEFATSVTGAWQRQGLGRTLMEAIIAIAAARGLIRMRGFVLAENDGMLTLVRKLGFDVAIFTDDSNLRVCTLNLTEIAR